MTTPHPHTHNSHIFSKFIHTSLVNLKEINQELHIWFVK